MARPYGCGRAPDICLRAAPREGGVHLEYYAEGGHPVLVLWSRPAAESRPCLAVRQGSRRPAHRTAGLDGAATHGEAFGRNITFARGRRSRMSEHVGDRPPEAEDEAAKAEDEAAKAGATSESYGNLTIEDDAEGTVYPGDLAGTGGPEDDAVGE